MDTPVSIISCGPCWRRSS